MRSHTIAQSCHTTRAVLTSYVVSRVSFPTDHHYPCRRSGPPRRRKRGPSKKSKEKKERESAFDLCPASTVGIPKYDAFSDHNLKRHFGRQGVVKQLIDNGLVEIDEEDRDAIVVCETPTNIFFSKVRGLHPPCLQAMVVRRRRRGCMAGCMRTRQYPEALPPPFLGSTAHIPTLITTLEQKSSLFGMCLSH